MNNSNHGFESFVNVLNNDTHCNSITTTSTESVTGVPMIGHDMFHQVGNNLVKIALEVEPELKSDFELYAVNLDNPAGFNYNGERLAMVAQEYVKAFSIDTYNGNKVLKATYSTIPTYYNLTRLGSLLSFDIKSSLSLGRHGFEYDFLDKMFSLFLDKDILQLLSLSLIEDKTSQIIKLFNDIYNAYYEFNPNHTSPIFNNLQRFTRGSIDVFEYAKLCGLNFNHNNCKTIVINELVKELQHYGKKNEVKKIIARDERIYTFYMSSDSTIFSLQQDIIDYYKHNHVSKALKTMECEFIKASGMSWKTYLNGSRFIAKIFDSIYLNDFDISNINVTDNVIRIKTNNQLSLLENDIIKYTNCCLTLNSSKIEDLIARTGNQQDTKKLLTIYTSIISPISHKIKELKDQYDDIILSIEEYTWYNNQIETLTKELSTIKLNPTTTAITDQLIKYYGYCDL